MTRVAVFTDNDFNKVNGVTTTLNAVIRHAPPEVRVRIYTAADLESDCPEYLSVPSLGVGLPWYARRCGSTGRGWPDSPGRCVPTA